MQFTISINQSKSIEWGLNSQQAVLFSFIYSCPSWCNPVTTDSGTFYALSKAKIVEELPLLTDKPDTAYRILKQLQSAGVIEISSTHKITLVRLTDKGKQWNKKNNGSEIYPNHIGKKSDEGRKNIRGGSENYPTNQYTSNQDTNNHKEITPSAEITGDQTADSQVTPKPSPTSKMSCPCPVDEILKLWKKVLPEKRQPVPSILKQGQTGKLLNDRWHQCMKIDHSTENRKLYHDEQSGLEFWEGLFNMIRQSEFLMSPQSKWFTFAWLVKKANFEKLIQGDYQ